VLVVARVMPVELPDEEVERVGRGVQVLRERVDEVPLTEEAVLNAAADWDVALRLQLLTGGEELRPRLRRVVRIEPRLTEVALVVRDPEPDGVEADTVLLALVDGQLRRSGRARTPEEGR